MPRGSLPREGYFRVMLDLPIPLVTALDDKVHEIKKMRMFRGEHVRPFEISRVSVVRQALEEFLKVKSEKSPLPQKS